MAATRGISWHIKASENSELTVLRNVGKCTEAMNTHMHSQSHVVKCECGLVRDEGVGV